MFLSIAMSNKAIPPTYDPNVVEIKAKVFTKNLPNMHLTVFIVV